MEKQRAMSAAAVQKLKADLLELESKARPGVIERIARAREHGDLSENGEYHAAREEQGRIEAKIRELTTRLKEAETVEIVDDGLISPGKVVSLKMPGGDVRAYLIGEREERSDSLDALSLQSPLGIALDGRRAGDTVSYDAPAGKFDVEILEVKALEVEGA